jgi:hypothetical protein
MGFQWIRLMHLRLETSCPSLNSTPEGTPQLKGFSPTGTVALTGSGVAAIILAKDVYVSLPLVLCKVVS